MATKTRIIPGYGIIVDTENSKTRQVPGYGIMANRETVAGGLGIPIAMFHYIHHIKR